MLESIHIQDFKGFVDTTIGPLRKVNLIVGEQNVGKTALLEYVYKKREKQVNENVFRVHPGEFTLGLTDKPQNDRNDANTIVIPCFLPLHEDMVKALSQLVMHKRKNELLDLLQKIDARLTNLEILAPEGMLVIFASVEGLRQMVSLPELGHGFSRLVYMYSLLLLGNANLALIDEVENGIHYSALPVLMQGIKNVAKERDVQTLMTTHSMDCIKAASAVFADSPEDFQVIRLVRTADNIEADIIPSDAVQAVLDCDGEVR